MKIGKVKIDGELALAPMAGVNTTAFRVLCKRQGAALIYSPMIVAKQLVGNTERILEQVNLVKEEKPISCQLVGVGKEMEESARIISEYADILDVNLGCPDKDILALHAGSFLIKHPDQIKKSVGAVMAGTNKPLTAKIRIGWDEKSINYLEVCKLLEDLGVNAIAIHGRTKKQGYAGKANWDAIREVKQKVNVPVIGNGDVDSGTRAKAMLEQTGCDMIMVGRAAMGDPGIFHRIKYFLDKGVEKKKRAERQFKLFNEFLELYVGYKGSQLSEVKTHAMWFTKGLSGSRYVRQKIMRAETIEKIQAIIKKTYSS